MTMKFAEVENPEKKEPENKVNELQLSLDDHFKNELGNGIEVGDGSEYKLMTYAKSRDVAINWDKALSTFMRLKAHPLAVKPSETPQPCLALNTGQGNLCYIMCNEFKDKFDYLSPMFDSYSDAEKAAEDIGEKNLVEMFKVFSGVYND